MKKTVEEKTNRNGVDWSAIDPETGTTVTTGDVSPKEIRGTWGYFSVRSADEAFIPQSILEAALKESKIRPDASGYYALHRSSKAYRILVLEPVAQRMADDEKHSEDTAHGAYVKRYSGLDNVKIESSVWRRIGVTFPKKKEEPATVLVAWAYAGFVYVSAPIAYANWRLTEPGMDQEVRELRSLRKVREHRGGFPGMTFGEQKRL